MADNFPSHVAIVPDGNRRWAKEHGLPNLTGHQRGAEATHNVVDYLIGHQLKHLTIWGFSEDNWKRNQEEITSLFGLLVAMIERDTPWLNRNGVRLRHIGRLQELPLFLQDGLNQAVKLTKDNTGMTFTLAFNYTGRAEIVDAVNQLLDERPHQHVDEEVFNYYLYENLPDVDLVIRTAGEFRVSNFLLWQTAYSEFYFTEALWPDFDEKELEKALMAYADRKRRFGGD